MINNKARRAIKGGDSLQLALVYLPLIGASCVTLILDLYIGVHSIRKLDISVMNKFVFGVENFTL